MKNTQSRFFVFTHWDIENKPEFIPIMNYMIYQHEICPDTGREHLQGYVEVYEKMTMKCLKKWFQQSTHIEIRKGSQEEAIEYASRPNKRMPDTRVVEYGDKSLGQGSRSDLIEVSKAIKKYGNIQRVAQTYPEMYIKYHKGMEKLTELYRPKIIRNSMEVYLLIGPPGTGKTSYVYNNHNINDIYKITESNMGSNHLWFDGYNNESVLLIDDFDGWIPYKTLITLLDRYPLTVQVKGGVAQAGWKTVYITTNESHHDWYGRNIDALNRRITKVFNFKKEEENSDSD